MTATKTTKRRKTADDDTSLKQAVAQAALTHIPFDGFTDKTLNAAAADAGVDKKALATAIAAHGHRHALMLPAPDKLAGMVRSLAQPGDFVICLGAGSITQWAYALPGELAALDKT